MTADLAWILLGMLALAVLLVWIDEHNGDSR